MDPVGRWQWKRWLKSWVRWKEILLKYTYKTYNYSFLDFSPFITFWTGLTASIRNHRTWKLKQGGHCMFTLHVMEMDCPSPQAYVAKMQMNQIPRNHSTWSKPKHWVSTHRCMTLSTVDVCFLFVQPSSQKKTWDNTKYLSRHSIALGRWQTARTHHSSIY